MTVLDLETFVARARALVDATPPATRRETRAWLVDPLLETLGWDVHADSRLTDGTVDDTRLEYALAVDGVPALFVAVEPCNESLDRSRAVSLLETMAWTGVDRAIYTNGRDFLLLAGTTDADRLACRLASLPDHESALSHYARETVGQRIERHDREDVARQLAVERATLVDAITEALTDATEEGAAYRTEFESAAERFLDRLVATFADGRGRPPDDLESGPESNVSIQFSERSFEEPSGDRPTGPEPASEAADGSADGAHVPRASETEEGRDGGRATDPTADPGALEDSDGTDDTASEPNDTEPERDSDGDGSVTSTSDGADENGDHGGDDDGGSADTDGEYVVRFFNERGSIGAIGHSRADQALVGAAEYLFDRGLSGVSVPWRPDGVPDERAVLNDSPTHADGTPMEAPHQLSNGVYLETAGDVDELAARLEALVSRAGLRAMLTGDWDER